MLLTSACTHSLEIIARLLELKEGDEVIVPSFTYVSSVQPFFLLGATIIFADVDPHTAQISFEDVRQKITDKTKSVVAVHYGGSSGDVARLAELCEQEKILLIEDAAQSFGARWNGKLLGTFGSAASVSFDRTKNVSSDKGGALIINEPKWLQRAKSIRANGSNRESLAAGTVNEYVWLDFGSQHAMSEMTAQELWPQLSHISRYIEKRKQVVELYHKKLQLPDSVYSLSIPTESESNYHIFALVFPNLATRNDFIEFMKSKNIQVAFHYRPLHLSPMAQKHIAWKGELPGTQKLSDGLVRLPLHTHLTQKEIQRIIDAVNEFFSSHFWN